MNKGVNNLKDILAMVKRGDITPKEGQRLIQELKSKQAGQSAEEDGLFNLTTLASSPKRVPALKELSSVVSGPNAAYTERYISTEEAAGDSPYLAVYVDGPGGIDDIRIGTVSPAEPGDREVQVLVMAFSINFGDLLSVKGM